MYTINTIHYYILGKPRDIKEQILKIIKFHHEMNRSFFNYLVETVTFKYQSDIAQHLLHMTISVTLPDCLVLFLFMVTEQMVW